MPNQSCSITGLEETQKVIESLPCLWGKQITAHTQGLVLDMSLLGSAIWEQAEARGKESLSE